LNNAVNALISRRLFMKAVGHKLPRNRRVPRPLQPTGLEREYYSDILKLIEPAFFEIREKLVPAIPEILRIRSEEIRTDGIKLDAIRGYAELITRTISDVRVGISKQITIETIQGQANGMAYKVNSFNKVQFNKQFQSVLGINPLLSERWLEPLVSSFTETNVGLIKSIPEQFLGKVEQMVRATVERGVSTEALTGQIFDEFDVTRSRAHLIARDQVSKFNSSLHEVRQKSAGVTKYIWSTSRDERVRPRHAAMDGKTVSWDDPPPVGNNGERLHVGQDFQCRCVSLPQLDEFL